MTLIVGIKCQDGVVMAADSAATFTTPPGEPTVCQTCKKLSVIGADLIIGTSGPVGLAQSFCQEIGVLLSRNHSRCYWKTPLDARKALSSAMWEYAEKEWQRAALVAQATRQPQPTFSTLIALRTTDVPSLIEFDQKCSPEEATDDLPYKCIGVGQRLADTFLAFTRRVLWPPGLPKLEHAVFYAYWAVSEAIKVSPGWLAAPVQIMTLAKSGESWIACELDESQLGEHPQFMEEVERAMGEAVRSLLEADQRVAETPSLPTPPGK